MNAATNIAAKMVDAPKTSKGQFHDTAEILDPINSSLRELRDAVKWCGVTELRRYLANELGLEARVVKPAKGKGKNGDAKPPKIISGERRAERILRKLLELAELV